MVQTREQRLELIRKQNSAATVKGKTTSHGNAKEDRMDSVRSKIIIPTYAENSIINLHISNRVVSNSQQGSAATFESRNPA